MFASNLSSYDFGNHEGVLKKNHAFPFWDCAFSQLKASHSGDICLHHGSINGNDKRMLFLGNGAELGARRSRLQPKKGLANVAIASPHMLPPMRVIVCATRYGVTVRVPCEIDTA